MLSIYLMLMPLLIFPSCLHLYLCSYMFDVV